MHLPPTLPSQAAEQAQPQLPTEIPPAQAQADLPAVQSEAAAAASSLAVQLTPALTQADEFCPRTLAFTIPAVQAIRACRLSRSSYLASTRTHGISDFTVDVLGNADLRGLFFHLADEATLAGLAGHRCGWKPPPLITNFAVQEDSVINLGQGAEMNGAASPFDVASGGEHRGPTPTSSIFRWTSPSQMPRTPSTATPAPRRSRRAS